MGKGIAHPVLTNFTQVYDFKAYLLEPGEMAQLIRALAALP